MFRSNISVVLARNLCTIPPTMSLPVHIKQLTKQMGDVTAVNRVSIDITAGDLLFVLGPSGCGKTTLLRMVAGLSDPTEGTICFGDRDVTNVPARKRNVSMVFQSYALWPHMTVAQNVEFGLKSRKIEKTIRAERVKKILKLVGLDGYDARKPGQLSGGQQQRVALARALVVEPDVLLLDEPLSNLDAGLRVQLRELIRDLCKQTGVTAIYVTHDQEEAMSLADKVAVMRDGVLEQVGTADDIYAKPSSAFIARFLGETSLIPGIVQSTERGVITLESPLGTIQSKSSFRDVSPDQEILFSIRPESVRVVHRDVDVGAQNVLRGKIVESKRRGMWIRHELTFGTDSRSWLAMHEPIGPTSHRSGEVVVTFEPEDVAVMSREGWSGSDWQTKGAQNPETTGAAG